MSKPESISGTCGIVMTRSTWADATGQHHEYNIEINDLIGQRYVKIVMSADQFAAALTAAVVLSVPFTAWPADHVQDAADAKRCKGAK